MSNNTILCAESVSAKKKRVIVKELVNGQEAATKLKLLLEKPSESEGSYSSSEELLANVLRSFSHAISVLTSTECHVAPRNLVVSGQPVTPSGIDPSSGDSSEIGKKVKPSPPQKNGRGSYKRRRSTQAWTMVSCTSDDNLTWRKYGQKAILNSEFPRSYFRCTHKYDQACSAIKQVQQRQENPKLYQITYIGIHTCNNNATTNTNPATHLDQDDHQNSLLPSLTKKQEHSKVETPSNVTYQKVVDPSSLWSDLKDLDEPSNPAILKMESVDSNKADSVYSCTGGGSQHLDMDFGVDFDHHHLIDTDFHIDESQLL